MRSSQIASKRFTSTRSVDTLLNGGCRVLVVERRKLGAPLDLRASIVSCGLNPVNNLYISLMSTYDKLELEML